MDVMMRNKIMLPIYCLMATLQIFTEIVGAEDTKAETVLKTLLKKRVVQNTAGDSLAKVTTMNPTAELIPTAMSGCHGLTDGKMYKIGAIVASGTTREGCGFALVCVEGGHLRTDREQNCRLTLPRAPPKPQTTVKLGSPPTPLTPKIGTTTPAWSGCVFGGKLYHSGEMIQSGQCFSIMCDYSGQIIFSEKNSCVIPPILHVG
ncbi:CTGF [Mytilus coruscus]|uniref:CTGF n=1 Tax=Mytilus coruscus TaxID=42192 RepID=A0A6J8D3W4_MYTCO|nr:CTGF [Mytilus coruscus]